MDMEALQKREQEQTLGTMVVATKTGHPMEQQHGHLQWENQDILFIWSMLGCLLLACGRGLWITPLLSFFLKVWMAKQLCSESCVLLVEVTGRRRTQRIHS